METFSALIKHVEEKSKVQDFMCQKLRLCLTETGRNKRFVTCKPLAQAIRLCIISTPLPKAK